MSAAPVNDVGALQHKLNPVARPLLGTVEREYAFGPTGSIPNLTGTPRFFSFQGAAIGSGSSGERCYFEYINTVYVSGFFIGVDIDVVLPNIMLSAYVGGSGTPFYSETLTTVSGKFVRVDFDEPIAFAGGYLAVEGHTTSGIVGSEILVIPITFRYLTDYT